MARSQNCFAYEQDIVPELQKTTKHVLLILDEKLRHPEIVVYTHSIFWTSLSCRGIDSHSCQNFQNQSDNSNEPKRDPEVAIESHVILYCARSAFACRSQSPLTRILLDHMKSSLWGAGPCLLRTNAYICV